MHATDPRISWPPNAPPPQSSDSITAVRRQFDEDEGVCVNSHEGRQYKARERRDPLTWRGIILKSRRSGNQYSTATFGYSWRVIFKPVMCGWKDGGSTRSCPTKMTFPFVLLVNKWVSLHNTPLFFPIITPMPLHYYNFTSRAFPCFKII